MSDEIAIVGPDMDAVMDVAVAFHATRCPMSLAESAHPMRTAERVTAGTSAACIVWLTGREEVAEVRAFLASRSECATVLLVPSMPPSAALARVVRSHGAHIASASEPPVVIVANLVAMRAAMSLASTGETAS